jgi:2-methylcitrate dehydratase
MIAVVLCKGNMVDVADYQDASPYATSKQLSDLRAKIELHEDPEITKAYHELSIRSATNGLTVTLNDGTVLDEVVVDFPLGSPKRTETLPLVHEKAKANLALILHEKRIEDILSLWASKDFEKKDVSELLDMFTPELPN